MSVAVIYILSQAAEPLATGYKFGVALSIYQVKQNG
jgi:hypothetical protein